MADAREKLALVPDDLGTSKVVGVANFGDSGGTPCCINGVSVLSACNFWCSGGFLPVVDEGAAAAHENADEACGNVEITVSSIFFADERGHGKCGLGRKESAAFAGSP